MSWASLREWKGLDKTKRGSEGVLVDQLVWSSGCNLIGTADKTEKMRAIPTGPGGTWKLRQSGHLDHHESNPGV